MDLTVVPIFDTVFRRFKHNLLNLYPPVEQGRTLRDAQVLHTDPTIPLIMSLPDVFRVRGIIEV